MRGGNYYVLNRWKFIENYRKFLAIFFFFDFKRAFETIERDILLRKLSCYGIKDKELKWLVRN